MPFGVIYCATRIDDNRKYYGQTFQSFCARKRAHLKDAKAGRGFFFHKQLAKHEFKWEIVEECDTLEQLNVREMFYIERDKTTDKKFGFNIEKGRR